MTVTLDPSDPKHAHAYERLSADLIVWLTTVDASGQPQSTPVWFWWDGSTFLIYSMDGANKLIESELDSQTLAPTEHFIVWWHEVASRRYNAACKSRSGHSLDVPAGLCPDRHV